MSFPNINIRQITSQPIHMQKRCPSIPKYITSPHKTFHFHHQTPLKSSSSSSLKSKIREMASEGPSWADQWGAGGIGALEGDEGTAANKDAANGKKSAPGGLSKAKSFASAGAQKFKNGTSMSFKWVKNKCQKKTTST